MQPEIVYKVHKIHEYPLKRPFLMSAEMEEIHRHFMKVENGMDQHFEKMKSLEAAHNKMISKMEFMEDSLKTVKEAITGNPSVGIKGMAERVADLEEKQKAYDKIYYKVIGAGIVISLIYPVLHKLITSLLEKI